MSVATMCPHTSTLIRETISFSDLLGSEVRTEVVIDPAYPCRIRPLSAAEIVKYQRDTEEVDHLMYSPKPGPQHKDKVRFRGVTYLVKGATDTDMVGELFVTRLLRIS